MAGLGCDNGLYSDILYVYTPHGGELKNNTNDISDEILGLIGRVVTGLLTADNVVTPDRITRALHHLSESTFDSTIRLHCQEIIEQLMKKMH